MVKHEEEDELLILMKPPPHVLFLGGLLVNIREAPAEIRMALLRDIFFFLIAFFKCEGRVIYD